MKYDNTKSLTENAMAGVDITVPEYDSEQLDTTMLYDLVYDRLANNTDYPMFEPEMADDMELVYDANTHQAEYITITIKGRQYELTIREITNEDANN